VNKIVTGDEAEAEFYVQCKSLLDSNDISSLVKKVIEHKEALFEQSSDTGSTNQVLFFLFYFEHVVSSDAEGCFSIISSLVSSFVKEQSDRKALIKVFADALTDGKSGDPTLRLKM
jgi:hypothetical protein